MIFQTYNRQFFLFQGLIFRGCTYCFIWNYGKICCSPFLKTSSEGVPVPHDLERIHTQIRVVSKKTPEIHPNSFNYPSSHNHGIVETCGNYRKRKQVLERSPTCNFHDYRWKSKPVNPTGLVSVPRSGQIYALYVYVEDHRFNTDGTLSRTVFVKVSLAG